MKKKTLLFGLGVALALGASAQMPVPILSERVAAATPDKTLDNTQAAQPQAAIIAQLETLMACKAGNFTIAEVQDKLKALGMTRIGQPDDLAYKPAGQIVMFGDEITLVELANIGKMKQITVSFKKQTMDQLAHKLQLGPKNKVEEGEAAYVKTTGKKQKLIVMGDDVRVINNEKIASNSSVQCTID